MKKIYCVTLFLAVLTATSCRKSKTDPPVPVAEGFYIGGYGAFGEPRLAMGVLCKQGGALRIYGFAVANYDTTSMPASAKSDGSWTLSGNVFTGSITNVRGQLVVFKDTLTAPVTSMNGTMFLKTDAVETPAGSYSVVKQ